MIVVRDGVDGVCVDSTEHPSASNMVDTVTNVITLRYTVGDAPCM